MGPILKAGWLIKNFGWVSAWCGANPRHGSPLDTYKRGDLLPPPLNFLTSACSQKGFWRKYSREEPLSSLPSHYRPAFSVMASAPPWGMCLRRSMQRQWGRQWDISTNNRCRTKMRSVPRRWGRQSGSSLTWTGPTSVKWGPGAQLLFYKCHRSLSSSYAKTNLILERSVLGSICCKKLIVLLL